MTATVYKPATDLHYRLESPMYSMYTVYLQRQDFNLHSGHESCIIAQTCGKEKQHRASTLTVPPSEQSDWPAPVSVRGRGTPLIPIWPYCQ